MRNLVRRLGQFVAVSAAAVLVAGAAHAQMFANSKLYVGTLSCNESGSVGLIFGSTKDLTCVLIRPNGAVSSVNDAASF